jgi:purine nucleosidase
MERKVIIDCDPGIDDSLAVMLALKSPEIRVAGITVVAGNSPVEMGVGNARKVLSFMHRLDIPVIAGADRPLSRDYVSALDTHGADGLGESFLPEVPGDPAVGLGGVSAVDYLEKNLLAGGCSLIALGPMTNLARLAERNPEALAAAEEIVSMGGNFRSYGNCSPVAEYNYWEDPEAARLVFRTMSRLGRKIRMVGLDVTRKIVLTPTLLEYMVRLNPEVGSFVRKITGFYFGFHWIQEHLIGCVINDPLAVAAFLNPAMVSGFDAFTDVETQGISTGQTVVDFMNFWRKPANAIVYTSVDVPAFWKMFLSRLTGISEGEIDLPEGRAYGED